MMTVNSLTSEMKDGQIILEVVVSDGEKETTIRRSTKTANPFEMANFLQGTAKQIRDVLTNGK